MSDTDWQARALKAEARVADGRQTIAELRTRVAELRAELAAARWRTVAEERPAPGQWCLCPTGYLDGAPLLPLLARAEDWEDPRGAVWRMYGTDLWMPAPDGPKERT